MKKLVALMLTVLIGTCAIMFAGCGSSFDGNYKEVEKGEVQTFSDEVSKTEGNEGVSIDYSRGFAVSSNYEMKTAVLSTSVKVEAKAVSVDGKVEMSGKVETNASGTINGEDLFKEGYGKINSEVYYKDGYGYVSVSANGISSKLKKKVNIGDFLDDYMNFDNSEYCSLPDLLVEVGTVDGVKFYMDKSDAGCKIKIVVPEMEQSTSEAGIGKVTVKGEFYLVYDAQNRLTAVKASLETVQKSGNDNLLKISFVAEPFSGKVSFPNDLDSYALMP